MTPCPFDLKKKDLKKKYRSHMAFSSVLPFLLPTHSVECAVHLLLCHSRALLVNSALSFSSVHRDNYALFLQFTTLKCPFDGLFTALKCPFDGPFTALKCPFQMAPCPFENLGRTLPLPFKNVETFLKNEVIHSTETEQISRNSNHL